MVAGNVTYSSMSLKNSRAPHPVYAGNHTHTQLDQIYPTVVNRDPLSKLPFLIIVSKAEIILSPKERAYKSSLKCAPKTRFLHIETEDLATKFSGLVLD